MRVLQIGSDRSKRGILVPGATGYVRQKAYAQRFGALDIIGYSLLRDEFREHTDGTLHIVPTNSLTKLFYGINALFIAHRLPRPDVISAQDPHQSGLLALWVAKWLHVPLHVQLHADIFADEFARHSVLNVIRRQIARFVLARADGIRVVSARIKRSVEAQVPQSARVSVLPIFTDIAALRAAPLDQALATRFSRFATRTLFVGRLESEKNPLLALAAFAASAPHDACLIFVGSGRERHRLEEYVGTAGIADRVFFEGEKDALPYYAVADLVLVPSVYEGYGLVIIEALAAGKPVLSTDVGIAREAGAMVTDEAHFADALKQWFIDGPRTAVLKDYPYRDFSDYVQQYCDDIESIV